MLAYEKVACWELGASAKEDTCGVLLQIIVGMKAWEVARTMSDRKAIERIKHCH
jgi:hypothetical protein